MIPIHNQLPSDTLFHYTISVMMLHDMCVTSEDGCDTTFEIDQIIGSIVKSFNRIYVIDVKVYEKIKSIYDSVFLVYDLFAMPRKYFPEQIINENTLNNYNYTRDVNHRNDASYVLDGPHVNTLIVKKYLNKFLKKNIVTL